MAPFASAECTTSVTMAVAYVLRLEVDGTFTFPYVSPSCAEMYGFTAAEGQADARMMHEAIHPEDRAGFEQVARCSAQTLEKVAWEGRIVRTDGKERLVTVTSYPRRRSDGSTEWQGLVVDRRPETDQDAGAAQEPEALEPPDFLAMLGHDIGTPLAVIAGHADWALEVLDHDGRGAGSVDADLILRRCLQVIARQSDRLDRLRNDLLVMAAADVHAIHAEPELVAVLPHLSAVAELRTRDIRVEIDCAADLTCSVQPGHLDQMLANLFSNAERFADTTVRLHAAALDGNRVHIKVEDDGPGVPAPSLDRLFARFAHHSHTRPAKAGAGLGLYIVQALARANGGTVVYERARRWTRFTISVPQSPQTAPTKRVSSP